MKKLLKKMYGKKNKKQVKKLMRKMKRKEKLLVLMSNVTVVHSVIAVLDMPQGRLKRVALAREILVACTNNAFVTVSASVIAAIGVHVTKYANAKKGSADAYNLMRNDLRELMGKFQAVANNDPANSIEIIKSGKFKVKTMGYPQKRTFTAENGKTEGVIILKAQGGGQNTCHDWQMSLDGDNFVRLPPTIAGKTKVKGLQPATYVYFTHELVTTKGGKGISNVIKVLVR